jgi:hypothetical protein
VRESELILVRQGSGLFNPANLTAPHSSFSEVLPLERRTSRTEMIRIANLYFDAIASNVGDKVPFTDDCNRLENGQLMTNNAETKPIPAPQFNIRNMRCSDNMKSRMWAYVTDIQPRRYSVIDEERGLISVNTAFHHNGIPQPIDVPGVGPVVRGTNRPFTVLVSELFKIEDGRIRQIEAVGTTVPYRMDQGW